MYKFKVARLFVKLHVLNYFGEWEEFGSEFFLDYFFIHGEDIHIFDEVVCHFWNHVGLLVIANDVNLLVQTTLDVAFLQLTFKHFHQKRLLFSTAHKLAIVKEVNNQVEKRYYVISTTGFVKVHLVNTSKHHISLKCFHALLFLYMFSCIFIYECVSKTKIYKIYLDLIECIFLVDHDVFRL